MKSIDELARYSGDPWTPENQYFKKAESAEAGYLEFWSRKIWPVISECSFDHVVDLAAGHGRNSEQLLKVAIHLTVVDIQAGNIAECRRRFLAHSKISFIVNNGFDLNDIGDQLVTLVYCFDSMVHFDSDVIRSYLREIHRVLKRGGHAFLHHSNYSGGHDWRANPASRNFMTRELFAHYAMKEGLHVVRQEVINWGGHTALDCLSLLRKNL